MSDHHSNGSNNNPKTANKGQEESMICNNSDNNSNNDSNEEDKKEEELRIRRSFHRKDNFIHYHYSNLKSTQDEARRLLLTEEENKTKEMESSTSTSTESLSIAVTATEQSNGRGTTGRQWMGSRGNTFVTVAIPTASIVNILPTLLPLKIGCITAKRILDLCSHLLQQQSQTQQTQTQQTQTQQSQTQQQSRENDEDDISKRISLKWPNDVLIRDPKDPQKKKKISGVLIESAIHPSTKALWYLIGIGVNVAVAPNIDDFGPNRGRLATSISNDCCHEKEEKEDFLVSEAQELGLTMARDIIHWVSSLSSNTNSNTNNKNIEGEKVLQEWKQWVDWGEELILRDVSKDDGPVIPIDVESDGRLKVIMARTGQERLLAAEYLF